MIALWACLIAAPDDCREVALPWDGSLHECMLFGQQAAAQWINQHPGWQVRNGWRCRRGVVA